MVIMMSKIFDMGKHTWDNDEVEIEPLDIDESTFIGIDLAKKDACETVKTKYVLPDQPDKQERKDQLRRERARKLQKRFERLIKHIENRLGVG